MSSCASPLAEGLVLEWWAGELEASDARRVERHLLSCGSCSARAELLPIAPDAGDVGTWLDGFLFSMAGPIYAGTNEIQRNVIAERVLKLPKG